MNDYLDSSAFSVGWAARLLGLRYPEAIRLFKKEEGLVICADGHLGVPGTWMLRFSAFRTILNEQREGLTRTANYKLPVPRSPIYMGMRDILGMLPLKFLYDPEHHEIKAARGLLDSDDPFFYTRGRIATKSEIQQLMLAGHMRTKRGNGGTTRILLNDLNDGYSWASPAETSWRRGAGFLIDLLRQRVEMEGLPWREPVPAMRRKEPPSRETKTSGVTADEQSGLPVTELSIILPQEDRWLSTSLHFDFEPRGLGLPGANKTEYLKTLPVEFLASLYCEAATWDACLKEERTGYRRTLGELDGEVFQKMFESTESFIYSNRKAWEAGVLRPLLPVGFNFLF